MKLNVLSILCPGFYSHAKTTNHAMSTRKLLAVFFLSMIFFNTSATIITNTELASPVTDCTIIDVCFNPTTSLLDWVLHYDAHPAPDISQTIKTDSHKFTIQPEARGAWWENSLDQTSINIDIFQGSIDRLD